jgi:serine phosphatase RsbU (regulator of sigma subunit)
MAVPLITRRGRLGLIYINSAAESVTYDTPELDELCLYAALIARQLEAIVAEQVKLQEAIAAGELSFVREIQARMDPTNVPQWEQLQLAVYCKPGLDRTGDVYDVMRLPNGLAAFLTAHAEASATRAALAMAEVRAIFRMASMHADPPHVVLRALNWILHNQHDPCLLHCAVIVMNPKTGAAEYATAGRIGAMIVDQGGESRPLADPAIPPIGQRHDYALPSRPERLQDDETLVFYTPGCRTVADASGQPLGDHRVVQAFCDGFGQSAAEALDEVLSDLRAFFKDGRQSDDITLLVVHRD